MPRSIICDVIDGDRDTILLISLVEISVADTAALSSAFEQKKFEKARTIQRVFFMDIHVIHGQSHKRDDFFFPGALQAIPQSFLPVFPRNVIMVKKMYLLSAF